MNKQPIFAITALMACALTACGQKGPLYLPEAPTEVVTRPAATPSSENTGTPNSPQTPDSAPAAPSPAPEVTAPESDPRKDKNAAPPPPK